MIHKLRALFLRRRNSSALAVGAATVILLGVLLVIFPPFWKDDAPADTVKKIYFADNISPAHQKVIDLFNAKHRGEIEVVALNIPFTKFSTNERKELFTRVLRNKSNQIDLYSVDQIWVPRFVKWCEPLDAYFTAGDKQKVIPYALKPCFHGDTLVTLPLFIDVASLYYRGDLLEREPGGRAVEAELQRSVTWERFIELGERFRRTGRPFYVFQGDNYEGLICQFAELLEGEQKPLYADGRFQLTTPEAVRAATLLTDLIHRYRIAPPQVTEFRENNSVEYYLEHGGMFLRGWPNFRRDYQQLGRRFNVDLGVIRRAPPPHFAGRPPVAILGGWNLMISRYSVQKQETAEFLKFLMSTEAQAILYEEGGYLPTNAALYDDTLFVAKHPELAFYGELLKTGVSRPALAQYTKYSDILSHYLKLALQRSLTPEEALRKAEAAILAEQAGGE